MKAFNCVGPGRILLINMERGDLLLESIKKAAAEANMPNAVILCAIGTVSKVRFHRVLSTAMKAEDEFLIVEGPIELASIQGIILNGEPHFHIVFSDLNNTYSGHLEDGTEVLYRAEVALAELSDLSLHRTLNAEGTMVFAEK